MHRDPSVMATLGSLGSDEVTAYYLQDNLDHWERYGYGIWVSRDSVNGRFVGRATFERLDLKDIVRFTLPTNRASQRVMEKAGLEYERDVVHANLPHVLYRIKALDA